MILAAQSFSRLRRFQTINLVGRKPQKLGQR